MSDTSWKVGQVGQALSTDLAEIQHLASTTIGPTLETDPILPYNSESSPVQLMYVHHRLDRFRGLQFVTNFKMRSDERLHQRHSFTLFVQRSLGSAMCHVALSQSFRIEPIYILVPYHARPHRLRLLLTNFLHIRETLNEPIVLIISIVRGFTSDERDVQNTEAAVFAEHADEAKFVWLHRNNGDSEHQFSRAVAIRESAKLITSANAVLFQCDIDMYIQPDFFHRCRRNTKLGTQVYYPVFYSFFPYGNARLIISQQNGFWRSTSFGMVCLRKGDFDDIGAFADAGRRFHGWGGEDVFQFETIRNSTSLTAFRAIEPALMHRWHAKSCDRQSEGFADCMKTNFVTMGHPLRIGPTLFKFVPNVNDLFKALMRS